MIAKTCSEQGCAKQPNFGKEGGKPTKCSDHKTGVMIDIRSKQCAQEGCAKQANFGVPGKHATHCTKHKDDATMKDVNNRECAQDGCTKVPNFGVQWRVPTHCGDHRGGMSDVMHTTCMQDGCKVRPTFGLKGAGAICCSEHASGKMVDVVNTRCAYPGGCPKIPNFGLEWQKPTFCKTHASANMLDTKKKRCVTCLATAASIHYKPHCSRCYFYLNPESQCTKNFRTKEHTFMQPLYEQFDGMVLNKVVIGGCSKRRPDGLLDCGSHSVIIEIDEDQHVGYDPVCENRRTMELFQDLGSRPLVFIRLNPDAYKIGRSRKPGCFTVNKPKKAEDLEDKKKIPGTLKHLPAEIKRRMQALVSAVTEAIANVPDRAITTVKLFYNMDEEPKSADSDLTDAMNVMGI